MNRTCEWSLLCVALFLAFQPVRCQRPAEVVRNDWYLRESLCAIRDWEAILDRWEKEKIPEASGTPVFPVPANGQTVEWPIPIPWRLRPGEDRALEVRVCRVQDRLKVERVRGARAVREDASEQGPALGYRHPGAGGKDGMYIDYVRKFDRLTVAEPRPAPFALELDGLPDLGRGLRELTVSLRNLGAKPLALTLQLDLHEPEQTRSCGRRTLAFAVAATEVVRFQVGLRRPGGGLLVLRINDASESFWVPLFTHVENLPALFEAIGQILADAPDVAAQKQLAGLKGRAAQWDAAPNHMPRPAAWRALFEEASALRDRLLLSRIDFDRLLFTKRKPYVSIQPFMDAHHMYNPPGGGIYVLSPVRPDGKVTPVLDSLGEGIYRDVCLHWTAKKLLISFGNGSDLCWDKISPDWDGKQSYHIYEVNADGTGLRQLTAGPKHDCEPFYLPDGQIGFTSDRSEHYVMCGGDVHAPSLYVMNADGSGVRQLSFNVFNDYNPCVMPDGRILYGRWEYNERSVTSVHNPFTVNPDGSMMATLYGNATIVPNVIMFPRPVPGSHKIMALFTSHHGQTHGAIGVIDARQGVDGMGPVTLLTPDVPVTGQHPGDSYYGWFSDPTPLDETTYLCSFTPTVRPWLANSWALYVGDRHGNLALVYRDPEISCAESIPLRPRPQPHIRPAIPPQSDTVNAEATLLVADVYVGLTGVPRGTAKYLRILEDVPRKGIPVGGVVTTSGTPIYTIKRIFGTVPVETDGSAHFVVPADRNVYFELLDDEQLEIQRMRSVVCLKPGERRTCIGCHEPKYLAPPNKPVAAARRPASRPVPPPWGTRIVSFLRDVQPVLDSQCVSCHTHDRSRNRVVLTDELTDQFSIGYEELLRYLSVASSRDKPWDRPQDVYPRPPYTYGSKASRLIQLLTAGHQGVKLSEEQQQRLVNWIDANGVYYDRYETEELYPSRRIFKAKGQEMMEIYNRRCASCHKQKDGRQGDGKRGSWWLSLNWHDVKQSRGLAAPLARAAGGWQSCGGAVFVTAEDPDYKKLLATLTELRKQLAHQPRADLLDLAGASSNESDE